MNKEKFAMLAKDYDERKVKFPCYVEPKFDGVRVIAQVDKTTKSVEFFFRSGKEVFTLEHLIEPLLSISSKHDKYWVDGEIIHEKGFMTCVGDVRRKSKQAPHLEYAIFDMVYENDSRLYIERKEDLISDVRGSGTELIFPIDYIKVDSMEEVKNLKKSFEKQDKNCEGVMIKKDTLYQHKRTWDWMKIKDELSVDFPIVGAYEGQGKYDGMLGGVIVENPKTKIQIRVGGGYTDEERYSIWHSLDDYIGKTAEVKYQYMTPKGSLRHPVYMGLRIDK
jgi:DNA ligase-1